MKEIGSILILFSIFACNKNNGRSRTETLCDSPWVYKEVTKNGVNLFATTPAPCFFDNLYTYKKDGTFDRDENIIKCDPNNPQIESFSWFFFSNEDSMSNNGLRVKIIELSETKFITEFTNSANDKFLYVMGKQ